MAPSPELGQPKAPDKTDTTTTGTAAGGKSEEKTDSGDKYESIKETDFSSITTTTTTTSNTTTTNTTKQQDSENLSNLDERALEALLKEAITYKTPRDREHKSEMFRELLQDAEKENQKSDFSSYDLRYRKHKGSSRHTQGGSLQDLAETDNLDDIFGHNKKHYNLKQRHSSVSSRQREGGSLPSNVNVSFHNLMSFDTSCMFDVNLKKKCKNSGMHSMKQQQQQQQLNSKDESQLYDSKIVGDTVIEIGDDESDDNQTNIPYEPLQEELSDPINPDVDYTDVNSSLCQKLPRIQPQRQYTSQAKIEISETSPPRLMNQSNADKTVSFSLLENNNNKNNVDMTPVQLNPSYNSVESIVGNKSTELNPRPSTNKFISANIFPQKLDVGDTSVQPFNASLPTSSQPNKSKNKKVPKSDRNTITVDYTKKEGFRGNDTINDLVRYIEAENETEKRRKENSYNNNNGSSNNNNNSNSNNPSNNNHNNNGAVLNSNNSNKKSKNNNNNSKKDSSKLKKCNSLEELSSCSKLKELKDSSSNSHTSSSSSSASSSSASSTTSQNQTPTEAVTLRTKTNTTKSKQNSDPNANIVISNSTTTGNNNCNNKKLVLIKKRSERRSWGTEELSYLGDSKVNSDYIKNNEILKNNSDDVNNNDDESLVICSGSYNINSLESNELISSQVNSMDASEFLLVTKKKKPKKIKLENNNNNMNNNKNSGNNNNNNRGTNNRSKYNYNNSHMTHNTVTNQNNHHPHHNDRDIYLNSFSSADNNRRKSTSSVPPSERSDSSDLDSVHSLPVESIKSIQMSNKTIVSPPAATKQSSNQISYADIAKIPNKQNINVSSNNIDILNNNSDNINTALSVTATDNLLNKQLLYSKSLNEIKTLPNQLTAQPQQPNGIIMSQIQNKTQFLLKSKSVDNDNYNVSIDQYPALEKTVKKSSNTNSINVCNPIIDNRMNKTSKKLPSPQNFVATTISTPKKILIEPIEVSQIEQSIVDELYNKPVLNNKPATLKQVVVNNNNNANINKLNEFTVAPVVEILPVVVTPGPVLPIASISSSTSSTSTTSKRLRKDKSNPNGVALKNNINSNSSSSSSNRPAVIILNDMDRDKPSNDITFGFEINQKLLFGDFNEDDMKLFETGTPQTTTTTITTNNSDVSDYFSISDTSLELSSTTTMMNNTPVSVSNPSNNNNNKLQDTDNQCDIINSVEQVVDKLNNNILDNNNSLDKNENFMKICETDITKINFKAPNLNDIILTEHNHDKIVNFIESAWEDIVSGTNGGAQYYNGQ